MYPSKNSCIENWYPDCHQNLVIWSLHYATTLHNISPKSAHNKLDDIIERQVLADRLQNITNIFRKDAKYKMASHNQTYRSIEVDKPWLLTVSDIGEIRRAKDTNCILGTLLRKCCNVMSSLPACSVSTSTAILSVSKQHVKEQLTEHMPDAHAHQKTLYNLEEILTIKLYSK